MRRHDADGIVDFVNGLVDVTEGALLQALRESVVFFLRDVLMGLFEELYGTVQAAGAIQSGVDWRVIVQVLAVLNGGLFDFVDGLIDLMNGFFFFFA